MFVWTNLKFYVTETQENRESSLLPASEKSKK